MSAYAGIPALSGRRLHALIWVTLLSGLAYLGVSLWSGWREVTAAMGRVGLLGVAAILALSLVNYGLRFVRWQYYLGRLGHRVRARDSLRIYLAGFGLTIVPGKVGEAIRSVFLKGHGVGYRPSLAAFFTERFSDLISMLCLAAIGVWMYRAAQPVLLLLAAFLCAVVFILHQQGWIDGLHQRAVTWLPARLAPGLDSVVSIIHHARICLAPQVMLAGVALGIVAWGSEGLAFHFVLDWMGVQVGWQTALFIYAFAMLVGAISFLPGGLGGADATMIGLLAVYNVPLHSAVAATILIRIATLWFAVVLGIGALGLQLRVGIGKRG
jgi:uncharacterized membrane protein YbhN (UPF0104 family)